MFSQYSSGPNGPIEYKILTKDRIEAALSTQQESMKQENVARGVGIYEEEGAAEALSILFREVVKDDCSVIAVDVSSDEVVGASFNKLHFPKANDEIDPLLKVVKNHLKPRSSLALVNFLDDVESRVDMFERYGTNAAMEIFYVGIAPGYQGYKIGHGLVERSIKLAENFVKYDQQRNTRTAEPGFVFGVFTSNFSQSIASKLNFEWLTVAEYEDYEYNGIKMSERIGEEHKNAKLGALKL
ncbi:uncharacterized protein [Venturia canescens]|uniref:uncharacterized protein n=1 Tax=Venturia canescens TaxID=32260 RepID=UPI001C9CFB97|nr:uncharacterized protein LOC122408676 [Venturia canescens]